MRNQHTHAAARRTVRTRGIVIGLAALAVVGLASSARASCSDDLGKRLRSGSLRPSSYSGQSEFTSGPGIILASFARNDRDDPGKDPSIVGLWRVAFTVGGQIVDEGFDVWTSDGTEILNDTVAPSTGNVCLGVYQQTARRTYKLKHPSWTYDANGLLTGTAIIGELVRIDRDGRTFSGTTTLDVYDLDNNLLFHGEGEITAKRITVN